MIIRSATVMMLLGATVLLTGCGGGGLPVDGKVVNGSNGYSPDKDGDVTINLTTEDGKGGAYSGKAEADGAFAIKAADGGGVPAGKYKVGVTRYPAKAGETKPGAQPPKPANKSLPEPWEVSSSNHTFTIDLTKLK